jgi:hypothetical protein
VVDIRRFQQGQFAPDMWLLQAYRNTAAQLAVFNKIRLTSTKIGVLIVLDGVWIMKMTFSYLDDTEFNDMCRHYLDQTISITRSSPSPN